MGGRTEAAHSFRGWCEASGGVVDERGGLMGGTLQEVRALLAREIDAALDSWAGEVPPSTSARKVASRWRQGG